LELQEEQKKAKNGLDAKLQESSSLASEAARLRDQLQQERSETTVSVQLYQKKIESLNHENTRLQMKLMRTQDPAKESEAVWVKKEIEEKTRAIEQVMQELQQQQQATIVKVKNLAKSMLSISSSSSPQAAIANTASPSRRAGGTGSAASNVGGGDLDKTLSGLSDIGGYQSSAMGARGLSDIGGYQSSAMGARGLSDVGGYQSSAMGGTPASVVGVGRTSGSVVSISSKKRGGAASEGNMGGGGASSSVGGRGGMGSQGGTDVKRWFQSMKANLEHFGEVTVFMDSSPKDCSCCLEPLTTPYRIRPCKCAHVFHIECLLQWWTEGTCPVCRVSFAPEGEPGAMPNGTSSGSAMAHRGAGLRGPGTFGAESSPGGRRRGLGSPERSTDSRRALSPSTL